MGTLRGRVEDLEAKRSPPSEGHAARDAFLARIFRSGAPHLADGPIRLRGWQIEHIQNRAVLGSIFSGVELVRDDNHADSIATALSALLGEATVSLRTRLDALEARHSNVREITPEHRLAIVEAAMPGGGETPEEREFLTRWVAGTATEAEATAVGLFPLDTRDDAGCIIRVKFVEGQPAHDAVLALHKPKGQKPETQASPVLAVSFDRQKPEEQALPVLAVSDCDRQKPDRNAPPIKPPIKSKFVTEMDFIDAAFLRMPKPRT